MKNELLTNMHQGDTGLASSALSSFHGQSDAAIEESQSEIIVPPTSPPHSHQQLMKPTSEDKLDQDKSEYSQIGKQVHYITDWKSAKLTGIN